MGKEKCFCDDFKILKNQRDELLKACRAIKDYIDLLHKHWEEGDVEVLKNGTGSVSADDLDAGAEKAFVLAERAIAEVEGNVAWFDMIYYKGYF